MVEMPLFALGLQPGGSMTRAKAQQYIDTCRSRRNCYRVVVMESGLYSPTTLRITEDISQWAYKRALAALDECRDAAGGIGLQSNQFRLVAGDRIIPVRMAAAALVLRNKPDVPIILVATNGGLSDQARLVGQALSTWREHSAKPYRSDEPIINGVALRVAGI